MPDRQTMICTDCNTDRFIGQQGERALYPCQNCQKPTEHVRA